ncbi:unnamed protein product, partial [Rotaria sp. Silwood1]
MKPPGVLIYSSNNYAALERSTTKPNSIDIPKFLLQYPNYVSIYESWQRLDGYMQNQETTDTNPSTISDENNDD